MPVPPPPFTFHCPQCGWQKTVVPKSDALVCGLSWFEVCPKCSHSPLERAPATMMELAMAKIRDAARK